MKLLAADLGGTRLKLGLVDRPEGEPPRLLRHAIVDVGADRLILPRLDEVAQELRKLDTDGQAVALGVSFPSIVVDNRVTTSFDKYADATSVDWLAWSDRSLGLPVVVDNDARCAAVGEWQAGAGQGCDDLVVTTLGTGIGTAAIVRGVALRGAHGQAGIMAGHVALPGRTTPCACGSLGCADVELGQLTLSRRAQAHPRFAASPLREANPLDYAAVYNAGEAGDLCAKDLWHDLVQGVGALCVHLIHCFDPTRIVLGGGVMHRADSILPTVGSWVEQHACTPWGQVELVAARQLDHAGVLGAACLAADQLFLSSETTA